MKVRQPRTIAAATALLERRAQLSSEVSMIEANRASALAATNAVADTLALPLMNEIDAIDAAIEPWWAKAGAALTGGKRKSIELGGCQIGTRSSAGKLEFSGGDDKAALAAASESPLKRKLTQVKTSLDKKAIATLLAGTGKAAIAVAALGFSVRKDDVFFVQPIGSDEAKVTA